MLWLCAACLVLLRASDCESICYVRIWLSCAVPYMLCELVLSSCHEISGEITLKFGNVIKMFYVFSAKITIRNLYVLNMSVQLHCINGKKCIIMLTLISLSCSKFPIR